MMENLFLTKDLKILNHMIKLDMLNASDFVSLLSLNERFHDALEDSNQDIWRYFYQQRFADPWFIFEEFFVQNSEIFYSHRYDLNRLAEPINWRNMLRNRVNGDYLNETSDLSLDLKGRLSDLLAKVTVLIENIRNNVQVKENANEALDLLLDSLEYVGPSPMVFHLLAELSFSVNGLEEALGLLQYSLEMDPDLEHSLLLKDQIEDILLSGGSHECDNDLPEDLKEMLNEIFDFLVGAKGTCSIDEFRKHLVITTDCSIISDSQFYAITGGSEFLTREQFLHLYALQTLSCPEETMKDLERYGMFDK